MLVHRLIGKDRKENLVIAKLCYIQTFHHKSMSQSPNPSYKVIKIIVYAMPLSGNNRALLMIRRSEYKINPFIFPSATVLCLYVLEVHIMFHIALYVFQKKRGDISCKNSPAVKKR